MKKQIIRLISVMADPVGAYILSFVGLFFYFFYISNDLLHLALTGAFFFGYFMAYVVVLVGSLLEEAFSL